MPAKATDARNVIAVNRYKLTPKFLATIKDDLDKKVKWRPFIRRFKPKWDEARNALFIDKKEVIPADKVEKKLEHITKKENAPLGINNLHFWVQQKYYGITRKKIIDFLKTDPTYQKTTLRPAKSKLDRSRVRNEGLTSKTVFKKWPNTLGIDLIHIGKNMLPEVYRGKQKYIVVVVHKFSGYVWAELLGKNATAKVVLRHFQNILADAKKLFGRILSVEHDNGQEFKKEYKEWLFGQGIRHVILKKVSYVEKANSVLSRNMRFIIEEHKLPAALKLAVEKMNNTRNRTLRGKLPKEMTGFKTPKAMVASVKKKFAKYKGGRRKVPTFKKDDVVQVIMKSKDRETGGINYKSYNMKSAWSNPTGSKQYVIESVRKGGKYKVTNVPYLMTAEDMKLYTPPRRYEKKWPKKKASPHRHRRPRKAHRKN